LLRYAGDPTLRQEQRSAQLRALHRLPALQQPSWQDHADLAAVRAELADRPALVDHTQIRALRQLLSRVEVGAALLLHVGECAETFAMANPWHVEQRINLYCRLADRLAARTGRAVVLLTRMAGQHAKPRSESVEALSAGDPIPTYRGDAVNSFDVSTDGRQADPARLLASYACSRATMEPLRGRTYRGHPVFVSHEALLRDYEEAMTRIHDDGPGAARVGSTHYTWAQPYALSAHLVWIGDRTRQLENWHIQWATSIGNPVGVKIGPTATGQDVVALIRALNPRREYGRLSLIARLGATGGAERLREVARAARESGAPILWQCDPMHGNTRKVAGTKVRLLPDLRAEITSFVRTLQETGYQPGGLHLEVTPEDVRECHDDLSCVGRYESNPPCDPRLNPDQATAIIDHFADEISN